MFDLDKITELSTSKTSYTPKPTASSFADWVFMKTVGTRLNIKKSNKIVKQRGIKGHFQISKIMSNPAYKKEFGGIGAGEWELIYEDHTERKDSVIFECSKLKLNNEALSCKPDVILRLKNTENYLIIERKTTDIPFEQIPTKGWPNVEAQLWVYSWMDCLSSAKRVYMVADYWTWDSRGNIIPIPSLDKLPFFEKGEIKHEEQCEKYFKEWGGEVCHL